MRIVEPKVALVAETKLVREGVHEYLQDIGAEDFELNAPTDAEQLITIGGKLCYRSWKPKMNPNVTKVRNDNAEYIGNINETGHGSVIEHANVSFVFWNVSRVFTHELARHRAGTAISQESLRYVRLEDIPFWMPGAFRGDMTAHTLARDLVLETVSVLEKAQKRLAEIFGIDDIKSFDTKKKLTSAFRRIAPDGLATSVLFTMNMRAARHIVQLRTSRHAEEEIRFVFDKVGQILKDRYPNLFRDFSREEIDGIGEWTSPLAAMPYDVEKTKKASGAKS